MSSGTYFPPAVKGVAIPKKTGGVRILGIPTVGDRICQKVITSMIEGPIEACFLPDSYAYRPDKSCEDALKVTPERCWEYDWVLEFDVKGLFDNIPHERIMKALQWHTKNRAVLLYVERWLKVPIYQDGKLVERTKGVPQGGVISPLLANLFMHYAFDMWMAREHRAIKWCRYADDGLMHCVSIWQARFMLESLKARFKEVGIEVHPDKTRIVYCKDDDRDKEYENTKFTFLGFDFEARTCMNHAEKRLFRGFNPGASKAAKVAMIKRIRKDNVRNRVDLEIEAIAAWYNPILRGWFNYYGAFRISELNRIMHSFENTLVKWARHKYRHMRSSGQKARAFLQGIRVFKSDLFEHWARGMT